MNIKKIICVLLAIIIVAGCFTACDNGDDGYDIWKVDTGKFNEGKVEYQLSKSTAKDVIGDDIYGQIVSKKAEGYNELLAADLAAKDATFGGKAESNNQSKLSFSDGKLNIPSADTESMVSLSLKPDCKTSLQSQISLDGSVFSKDSNAKNGLIIGVFTKDASSTPTSGDGIWITFNSDNQKLNIFATANSWNNGPDAQIDVKDSLTSNAKISVVCTYDKAVFIYVNRSLVGKVTVENGMASVFSTKKKALTSGPISAEQTANGRYTLIGNNGGMKISKMVLSDIPESYLDTHQNVTAVPVGDNKLGLDITDKKDLVSICYTMWFDNVLGTGDDEIKGVKNVSELLQEYKFSASKGFYNDEGKTSNAINQFHYWAEPAQGYYRSTDAQACRNNMTMLYNAGVDFIICDYTFISQTTYSAYKPGTALWDIYVDGPLTTLLNTIMQMRGEGLGTPYVVLWPCDSTLFNDLKTHYYDNEKYKDCFVYWNDKPLILRWQARDIDNDYFTVRGMYGLTGSTWTYQWSYLEHDNKSTASYDYDSQPEQMCCCVAAQSTYMSETIGAQGREGGAFWNRQWQNVFEIRPKIVTLTWWNEWCAQLLQVDSRTFVFTDNFNQEYSRDIEPMKGGHGDQYYQWLVQYIKDYKNYKECPTLVEK